MADTFEKKEKAKKKAKKKQEKAEKREERKLNNNKGKGFDSMISYVDEFGNLHDTPPDERNRTTVDAHTIQLGAAPIIPEDKTRTGVVSYFSDKGYGFIIDERTGENVFVHMNNLLQPVKERDRVKYEREKSPKGFIAVNVKKV